MTTWTVPATVERWVDGDTVRLRLDLGWHTYRVENCRIAGINAPELHTKGDAGLLARQFAEAAFPVGTEVVFVSKQLDKYGRPLGDVSSPNGGHCAERMLRAGHAVEYNP